MSCDLSDEKGGVWDNLVEGTACSEAQRWDGERTLKESKASVTGRSDERKRSGRSAETRRYKAHRLQ